MSSFFVSSRRRHTRWTGDWSSDVCSSDLGETPDQPGHRDQLGTVPRNPERTRHRVELAFDGQPPGSAAETRSEERRVGKEGRSRWAASDQKKKKAHL